MAGLTVDTGTHTAPGTNAGAQPGTASGGHDAPAPVLAHRPEPLGRRLLARRTWPTWADAAAVIGVTLVVLLQLHPDLLMAATTTAGGDTGGHVALPHVLEHTLLPRWRLTGWDPSWYDGFPLYTFYFPLPGVLVVGLNAVLPYTVAFKWVTVLGSLTLPVSAYAMGRLAGLRRPAPAALAAATLPFLFEPSFSIYGGNLLSTLAGEFSYSLSLSFALLLLGVVAAGLRTGRHRALAAVLFAATLLCHLLPALFAGAGAVLWLLLDADLVRLLGRRVPAAVARRRWLGRVAWAAVAGVLGLGLTAWWLLPFATGQAYTTNMGYTKVYGYPHLLFPGSFRWVLVCDLVALACMVVRRSRFALFLALLALLSAAAVMVDPPGKLYNVRFLPFWFLCLYLLAGWGLAEVVAAAARWSRRRQVAAWVTAVQDRLSADETLVWAPGMRITRFRRPVPGDAPAGAVAGPLVALGAALLVVLPPIVLPASSLAAVGITAGADHPADWAAWNFAGYERKPDYPEYRSVVDMMRRAGQTEGCGRAMWEYDASLNRFGTTMALMLLPYWTGGCIDSMEGLLFESSSSTPFHFINQNELSVSPSNAVVGLPYGGVDVALGIRHLQMLGVRYLLASSPTIQQGAQADPAATLVAQSGPWSTSYNGQALSTTWKLYRIADTQLVVPLAAQPVVWQGVGASQSSWLDPAVAWYDAPSRWGVVPAADGPASWDRVPVGAADPPRVAEPPVVVSRVAQTADSVSFHVDRTGVPVEVRISYFPNWRATGADGPFRVAPNLMVVVPTAHEVTLTYGRSGSDVVGAVVSLASAAGAVAIAVRERRRRHGRRPGGQQVPVGAR